MLARFLLRNYCNNKGKTLPMNRLQVTKVRGFASVSMYASMQLSSVRRRCCTPAPVVATPSPLHSSLLTRRRLAASLACLTSRPAALRDAPRYFTFINYSQVRNHCKNSLCNKNIFFVSMRSQLVYETERLLEIY